MAVQKSKQTSFNVALDEIKLTAAQKSNITRAINAAALQELAKLDLADGMQARVPPEWLGIWIDRFGGTGGLTLPGSAPSMPKFGKATVASVVLDGVKLTTTQRNSLESAIRGAAIGELGKIAPAGGFGVAYPKPKEWFGIWIGPYGKSIR
jgi:hypothetical protein